MSSQNENSQNQNRDESTDSQPKINFTFGDFKASNENKISKCNSIDTPMIIGQDLVPTNDDPIIENGNYMQMLGCVLYLSTNTRPNITYAVNRLCKYAVA